MAYNRLGRKFNYQTSEKEKNKGIKTCLHPDMEVKDSIPDSLVDCGLAQRDQVSLTTSSCHSIRPPFA
jgi:hypothetical protein